MSRYPRLTRSSAIAREAEKIFEGLLSSSLWNDVKVPQERDFGLDYRIEFVGGGELRGCQFFVQLKVFERVEGDPIRVRVKTTTLRYWLGQDLPVLLVAIDCATRKGYFCWIDKGISVANATTQTITIRREDVLLDYKLCLSIQTWYREWSQDLIRRKVGRYYSRMFHDTMLISEALRVCVTQLLFVPRQASANIAEYRQMCVDGFMTMLLKFLHDLRLYRSTAGLPPEIRDTMMEQMFDSFERRLTEGVFSVPLEENSPGWGAVMINPAEIPRILREVGAVLNETNFFFIKHYLGAEGVAEALESASSSESASQVTSPAVGP
jgi:hypothetical protein